PCSHWPRHSSLPGPRGRPAYSRQRHAEPGPEALALPMTAAAVVALAGAGFLVGLLAGLVGIGGGVLIVPFLYFFYAHPVWGGVTFDPALHATVAHATSLFIIIPTAIVGTITYSRAGLVSWRAVLPIAAFSL